MKLATILPLALMLAACGGGSMPSPPSKTQTVSESQPKSVCLIGDSRTRQGDWSSIPLSKNAGIDKQTSAEIAARLPIDCAGFDLVVLNAGTNDVQKGLSISAAESMLQAMALSRPGMILSTVPKIDFAARDQYYAPEVFYGNQQQIDELNRFIRGLASGNNLPLLDYASVLDPCAQCFQVDGVHYTQAGYDKLLPVVKGAVR